MLNTQPTNIRPANCQMGGISLGSSRCTTLGCRGRCHLGRLVAQDSARRAAHRCGCGTPASDSRTSFLWTMALGPTPSKTLRDRERTAMAIDNPGSAALDHTHLGAARGEPGLGELHTRPRKAGVVAAESHTLTVFPSIAVGEPKGLRHTR